MFFSVIMPLYNKAQYVAKTIASVLGQSYADWELIIVDDGSKDDSFAVASKAISGCDRALIIRQENAGVSTARNNGVALSKGDFVCFLDADDWWSPTFLVEMHNLITEYPDAGIFGSSYFLVKNKINKIAPIALDEGFEKGYINYIQVYSRFLCMPLWTGAICVKKIVFEEMQGFKPQLKLGEDFDLWLHIALQHKVAFVNNPLAYYNQNVDLINRAVGKLHKPETTEICCYSDYEKQYPNNTYLKQLLDNKRVFALMKYYLSKQYRGFAKLELAKIDWSKQPKSAKRTYNTPVLLLQLKFWERKLASNIIQTMIKWKNRG